MVSGHDGVKSQERKERENSRKKLIHLCDHVDTLDA